MMDAPTHKPPSFLQAVFILLSIAGITLGTLYVVSNLPPAPPDLRASWDTTQAEFEFSAPPIPSEATRVVGNLSSWSSATIERRHVVLCELSEQTPLPYDCVVSEYAATSNSLGQFTIDAVKPGRYLVLLDSGFVDFEPAYETWLGKALQVGDADWFWQHLFQREPDGSEYVCVGYRANFYHAFPSLSLAASGSPFGVVHNLEAAATFTGERFSDLPHGVFRPLLVEVTANHINRLAFPAWGCADLTKRPSPATG